MTELPGTVPDLFHVLGYSEPAQVFTDALPLGNGRLGAMCFGGAGVDVIRLNDGTAWSGSPASELAVQPQEAAENARDLRRARQLIREGRYAPAERWLAGLTQPYSQAYLPFADLVISVGKRSGSYDAGSYRRALDLRRAVHTHSYRREGNGVTQRVLVSAVHGVLVVELEAEQPVDLAVELRSQLRILKRISTVPECALHLLLPSDVAPVHAGPGAGLTYGGPSLEGAVVLGWEHDGREIAAPGGSLRAGGVRKARFYLATDTTFTAIGTEPRGTAADACVKAAQRVRDARRAGIRTVRAEHFAAHHRLYGRAALSLGHRRDTETEAGDPEDVPSLITAPQAAPELAALLFNYGRYLLLASSRPGSLPATLQGLWNEDLQPPWSSNYTLNINTEMNYWAAGPANLSECFEPFVDLAAALARNGQATAARIYGLPGWVAHHNTDAWAFSSPVAGDAAWSFWPMGAAWLSTALAEQQRLGAVPEAARERTWTIIRDACRFYLGWLQPMPNGSLGTVPSTSPENHFETEEGPAAAAWSSTADIAMIRQLFLDAVELGPEEDTVVREAAAALRLLPPVPLTPAGLVAEWAEKGFRHPEPDHRHLSHLWFAYPGRETLSPAVASAVSLSLDGRGDDSTGWSLVWKMALRARLGEAEAVGRLLPLILRSADNAGDSGQWAGGLYRNLFAAHPPFQIDGNLGFVAAVAECLIQSRTPAGQQRTILLLPALPPQWRGGGSVHGLVVVPGVVAGLAWEADGTGVPELVAAEFQARTAQAAGNYLLVWNGAEHAVFIGAEQATLVVSADFHRRGD